MNRRGFLKFFSVATAAAVLRPVMPFVASLVDKSDPFDQINLVTFREFSSARLADSFFQTSPLLEVLRSRQVSVFDGGREIQKSMQFTISEDPDWYGVSVDRDGKVSEYGTVWRDS